MARVAVGPIALALFSAPRLLHAEERSFSVAWQAPSECPDAAALERYVDQVVGEAASGPLAVRASGSASRSADGRYSATLELDLGAGAASARELEGRDCEAVSQAAALLIALAIRARAAPTPPEPAPVQPAPAPPAPPAPARHAGPRGFLGLGPIVDFGSAPGAAFGVGLSGGLRWPRLRLEPSLAYYAPRSEAVAGRPALGADFTLATLGVRACVPLGGSVWLGPCLGGGVDWLRGSGFGARAPRTGSAFSASARAGVLAGWDISPIISLRLELEGVLPLARPEFEVEGAGFVYRRSRVAARTAFGLDVHF